MVVAVGETTFEEIPITEPTELLIDNAVGAPPDSVHDSTDDCPMVMAPGVATNVLMIGAGGFTVTIRDLVTVATALLAVIT